MKKINIQIEVPEDCEFESIHLSSTRVDSLSAQAYYEVNFKKIKYYEKSLDTNVTEPLKYTL